MLLLLFASTWSRFANENNGYFSGEECLTDSYVAIVVNNLIDYMVVTGTVFDPEFCLLIRFENIYAVSW